MNAPRPTNDNRTTRDPIDASLAAEHEKIAAITRRADAASRAFDAVADGMERSGVNPAFASILRGLR